MRDRLVSRRTATINQIRAFLLEQGITVRPSTNALRISLFHILKERADEISPRMHDILLGLFDDWMGLEERVVAISSEIEKISNQDAECRRLVSVPGIGPIVSPAHASTPTAPHAAVAVNRLVEGKRIGLIPPLNATATLRPAKLAVSNVANIASSGRSGLDAL